MKLLAIDTSGTALSAAIAEDGQIIACFGLDSGKNHSLELLPCLQQLLAENQLALAEMDAFAVTIGPGSFTGLRIGIATVKAFAHALDKPLIGVSSLDAMAQTAGETGYVAPIFDARRDQVYTALFADGKRLSPDRAIAPQALAEELAAIGEKIVFTGDGLKSGRAIFAQSLADKFCLPSHGNTLFMAEAAALLATEKFAQANFTPISALVPLYLRLSEAEEKRLEDCRE